MLETLGIGPSLREARIRRGVGLDRVEAATRIRIRYLEAIEDDRWDELPAEAYAKGFLRTYASYLELDPQQYLAAFRDNRREVEERIAPVAERPYEPRRPRAPLFVGLAARARRRARRRRVAARLPRGGRAGPHRAGLGAEDAARGRAGDACTGTRATAAADGARRLVGRRPLPHRQGEARLGRDAASRPARSSSGSRSRSGSAPASPRRSPLPWGSARSQSLTRRRSSRPRRACAPSRRARRARRTRRRRR